MSTSPPLKNKSVIGSKMGKSCITNAHQANRTLSRDLSTRRAAKNCATNETSWLAAKSPSTKSDAPRRISTVLNRSADKKEEPKPWSVEKALQEMALLCSVRLISSTRRTRKEFHLF
jgi:hypothetical protein